MTEEEPKPIHFTDALGRKFTLPFELVKNWSVSDAMAPLRRGENDSLGPAVLTAYLPRAWKPLYSEPLYKSILFVNV